MSLEHQKYLSDHFRSLAGSERVQRNADSAWRQHGKYFPLDKAARILEIGPGFGAMLKLLRTKCGYRNVNAVDISPEVVDFCNQLVPQSTELTDDTIYFLEERAGKYDLILMFHVLEHVPKDTVVPFLTAAREALKPNGRLIVETPNSANPLTGPYHRYHDFTHTVGFSDQSLAFVLRTAGFSNVSVYPCKVPRASIARLIQRTSQDAVEFMASLLLKLYMPRLSVILSSVLGACAEK